MVDVFDGFYQGREERVAVFDLSDGPKMKWVCNGSTEKPHERVVRDEGGPCPRCRRSLVKQESIISL